MKPTILPGAALAAAALALALATPAEAKHHGRRAAKPAAEKHSCGGKNGCPGMNKSDAKEAAPAAEKAAEPK